MVALIFSKRFDLISSFLSDHENLEQVVLSRTYDLQWLSGTPKVDLIIIDLVNLVLPVEELKKEAETLKKSSVLWAYYHSNTPANLKQLYKMGFSEVLQPENEPERKLEKFLSGR